MAALQEVWPLPRKEASARRSTLCRIASSYHSEWFWRGVGSRRLKRAAPVDLTALDAPCELGDSIRSTDGFASTNWRLHVDDPLREIRVGQPFATRRTSDLATATPSTRLRWRATRVTWAYVRLYSMTQALTADTNGGMLPTTQSGEKYRRLCLATPGERLAKETRQRSVHPGYNASGLRPNRR